MLLKILSAITLLSTAALAQAPSLPTGTGGEVLQNNPTIINPTIVGGSASGASGGITPQVTTNAALQGSCTGFAAASCPAGRAVYSSGVWRVGLNAVGDVPPLLFKPQNSACSTQFGDTGSCVMAADGTSFAAVVPPNGLDVREFGVQFDGATDNSVTLQAAFTWWQGGNQIMVLPGATAAAKFGTPIVATFATQNVRGTISGAGRDASRLAYQGSSGTAITVNYNGTSGKQNSVSLRDFTLCTNQNGGANGILLSETTAGSGQIAQSDISQVSLRGCDGYGVANFWTTALSVNGPSEFNFIGLTIDGGPVGGGGTGVLFHPGALFGFQYNFIGLNINNLTTAIQADANVQGLTITNGSNVVGVATVLNVTSGTGTDQFFVADSQFNCQVASSNCFIFTGGGGVIIRHNLIFIGANNVTGINVTSGINGVLIEGNLYENLVAATGTTGETFNGTELIPSLILGNTYVNLANSRIYSSTSSNYPDVVKNNVYSGVTTTRPAVGAGTTTLSDVAMPFSTVSPCTAALLGYQQIFSDNNTAAAFAAVITGSGAGKPTGYCNGTNWTMMSN